MKNYKTRGGYKRLYLQPNSMTRNPSCDIAHYKNTQPSSMTRNPSCDI